MLNSSSMGQGATRPDQGEPLVACPRCGRLFSVETLLARRLSGLPQHVDQRDMKTLCSGSGTPMTDLPVVRANGGRRAG